MSFPRMPLYVRNDSFGPASHNNLLQRQDHLTALHGVEHDPVTGGHNTPHVARTLGHVTWDGASYSYNGFNEYFADIDNPAVGTVEVQLQPNSFDPSNSIVEVQPADDSGSDHPWFTSIKWVNSTKLHVFLKKNTATVGTQQTLAATDGEFFISIKSTPLTATAPGNASARRVRGEGLAVGTSDWNPMIQRMGDNRYAMLQEHTAAGLHNAPEVAKAWAYVKWDSNAATYSVVAHQGIGAGVSHQNTGHVRVYLANCVPSISSPVQAFARAISSTDGSTDHTGLRTTMVPSSTCGTSYVDLYLFASQPDINLLAFPPTYSYEWVLADCDFFIRVHGA